MTDTPAAPNDDQRNIVLTGFMGTGKTTVGRILARKLRRGFLDTDGIIEGRHGKITEIFATQGETAFRQIEQEVAAELAGQKGLVIATGGRLLLDPANIAALSATGYVYGLAATVGQIYSRVNQGSGVAKRPLLAGPDPLGTITDLLAERAPQYRRFPQVAAGTRKAERVAAEIIKLHEQAPSVLQSETGARAVVGINLLSQLPGSSVTTLVADADNAALYLPFLGGALTVTEAPHASSAGSAIVIGDHSLMKQAPNCHTYMPTDWSSFDHAAATGLPLTVDLAALQPDVPEHGELEASWKRALSALKGQGWTLAD